MPDPQPRPQPRPDRPPRPRRWRLPPRHLPTLRATGTGWVALAFAGGLAAGLVWAGSQAAWQAHLARAQIAGLTLFGAVQEGRDDVPGVRIDALNPVESALAAAGDFTRLGAAARRPLDTVVTIRAPAETGAGAGPGGGPAGGPVAGSGGRLMTVAILSSQIRYPVSRLDLSDGIAPASQLGAITRLMAGFCSDPAVIVQNADGRWFRVDGAQVWNCEAAPADLRLIAALIAALSLSVALASVSDVSAKFAAFAEALHSRRHLGGPDSYEASGPAELRDTVRAVNGYLERERAALIRRADMLSGVSHDLGAPATRLRLRAALITDDGLRRKLDADIDSMTGMIDSVLAYTRSEQNVEAPRRLSLAALVEALVADYQDLGRPVDLAAPDPEVVEGAPSVLSARRGQHVLTEERRVLVTARPMALTRAVTNIVENAIRYGRRATLRLTASSTHATIAVEDEGGAMAPDEMERLTAPFRRGANAPPGTGFGLGLTIAAAVAEQHGGRLDFDRGPRGLIVRLTIERA